MSGARPGHATDIGVRDVRGTVLVLDVGLTHAKAVLFDLDGRLVGSASRPIPTHRPGPDRAEQDPNDWWSGIVAATRELRERWPEGLRAIVGIGVTAHMHALVCVGAAGGWLGPALVLGDRRAIRQAAAIEEAVGPERVYAITGTSMDPSMPAATIAWLREWDRPRHHETALFTGAKDAIRGRLTGDRLTDPIDACATSLWDIHARDWSDQLLELLGAGRVQLPDVTAPEMLAGPLLPAPASELGIRAGIPVVVGAGDDIEVLGCGAIEPGDAIEHIGTTGSILAVTDRADGDPDLAIELYPHALPGLWVLGGSMTAAGAAISWLAGLRGETAPTDLLAYLADGMPGAVPIFLPSLAGERSPRRDPLARGALVGLGLGTTDADVARAAFDGVAAAMARILRSVERLGGDSRALTVSAGGLGADPRWARRRAAIYCRELRIPVEGEATARGVAMLVAAGIGAAPDVRTAVRMFASPATPIPAAPGTAPVGPGAAELRLQRLAHALAPVWPRLAGPR
jgi:xylulokinase